MKPKKAEPLDSLKQPAPVTPVTPPSSNLGTALSCLAILAFLSGGVWWVSQLISQKPPQVTTAPAPITPAPAVELLPIPLRQEPAVVVVPQKQTPVAPTPVAPVPAAEPQPEAPAPTGISPELMAKLNEKAQALPLVGIDATARDVVAYDKKLIQEVAREGAWDEYRLHLQRSLAAAYKKLPTDGNGRNRYQALWEQPAFYQAFLRWQVLGLIPSALITKDGYEGADFFIWLVEHDAIMEEILLTVNPKADDLPKVAKLLFDAWQCTGANNREKYINLAIACAVVFDREVKIQTPAEDEKYNEAATVNPLSRYRWYMEKNEAGKLTAPVHHSSARDLVWLFALRFPPKNSTGRSIK